VRAEGLLLQVRISSNDSHYMRPVVDTRQSCTAVVDQHTAAAAAVHSLLCTRPTSPQMRPPAPAAAFVQPSAHQCTAHTYNTRCVVKLACPAVPLAACIQQHPCTATVPDLLLPISSGAVFCRISNGKFGRSQIFTVATTYHKTQGSFLSC